MNLNLPVVSLVGKPNVGKSTLFNRLIRKNKAIISDESGTTRDRNRGIAQWIDKEFIVYDTGGYIDKTTNYIQKEINLQVDQALSASEVIVFVVSCKNSITDEDLLIANHLRNRGKNIIVAVNKSDNKSERENYSLFYELGFSNVIPISALHGTGTGDLLTEIVRNLNSKKKEDRDDVVKFAIFGKQNVGKSTLTNSILRKDRVIVSDIPGTTRDPISIDLNYNGRKMSIVDTAGIKRNAKTKTLIDKRSMDLAKQTIREIDIGIILLDVNDLTVSQAVRIAGYIHNAHKPSIIAINKFDTIEKSKKKIDEIEKEIKAYYKFIDYSRIIFISALESKGVGKLMKEILNLYDNYQNLEIKTSELNNNLSEWSVIKPPPSKNGIKLNLKYAIFDKAKKEFLIFCNKPELMHFSYLRYLENQIRNNYNFEGIPILIKLKKA